MSDDFDHYYEATQRLTAENERLKADIAALKAQLAERDKPVASIITCTTDDIPRPGDPHLRISMPLPQPVADDLTDICPSEERMRGWSHKEYISHIRHVWSKFATLRAELAAERERRETAEAVTVIEQQAAVDALGMLEDMRDERDTARARCAVLEGLLRKIRPHIPHNAIDREKAMGAPISECYLNTMTDAALAAAGKLVP